jgi:hypothetical protein
MTGIPEHAFVADEISPNVLGNDVQGGWSVGMARYYLSQLPDEKNNPVHDYCTAFAPEALAKEKDLRPRDGWLPWLVHFATDEQLEDFIDWNVVFTQTTQASAQFEYKISQEHKWYRQRVGYYAARGVLHPSSIAAVSDPARVPQVQLTDVFDDEVPGRGAYYESDNNMITLQTGVEPDGTIAPDRHDLWHEYGHSFFPDDIDWFEEAAVEHIGQLLMYGQPYIVRASERPKDELVYRNMRNLVHVIHNQGTTQVSPGLWLQRITAHGDHAPSFAYNEAVSQAWDSHISHPERSFMELIGLRMHQLEVEARRYDYGNSDSKEWAAGRLAMCLDRYQSLWAPNERAA